MRRSWKERQDSVGETETSLEMRDQWEASPPRALMCRLCLGISGVGGEIPAYMDCRDWSIVRMQWKENGADIYMIFSC